MVEILSSGNPFTPSSQEYAARNPTVNHVMRITVEDAIAFEQERWHLGSVASVSAPAGGAARGTVDPASGRAVYERRSR